MSEHAPHQATRDLKERVAAWLSVGGVEAYLVGGAVRDQLMHRSTHDLDLVVDGDGLAIARRLANHFAGSYYPLDPERLVGRAILPCEEDQLVLDVASLRGRDLAADLADRDFTVNALAAPVADPERVIDLHGGLADLAARIIRPVSERSIQSDPVRVLRAVRLAATLDFSLAAETLSLMRRDGTGLVDVSGERIRDELARLLLQPSAAPWLRLLDQLDLLTIVLPELEAARDEPQPPPHHLDVLDHSLTIVETIESLINTGIEALSSFAERIGAHLAEELGHDRPRSVTLKLAALLHDVAKPARRSVEASGRVRFLGHDQAGARVVADVFYRLRFSRPEVYVARTIVRHHMRPLLLAGQKSVSSRAVYRFFRDTGDAGIDVILHSLADQQATYAAGSGDEEWQRLVELAARMLGDYWDRAELVAPPPLISGHDLIATFDLQPGPEIGELLEVVREAQVTGDVRTRPQALDLIRRKLSRRPEPPAPASDTTAG